MRSLHALQPDSPPLPRAPRRRRIVMIVLAAVLLAAIAEPIVMYRVLIHEKEARRAAAELPRSAVSSGSEHSVE